MYKHLHFFPIAVSVLMPINIIITYVWAVMLGHVTPDFPYISDTSSSPPESCFFTLLLNMAAVLMACCIYLQYRKLDHDLQLHTQCGVTTRANAWSARVGATACLGLAVVASFQEYNVLSVHLVGAVLCFLGGTVYFCWQSWLSHKMRSCCPVSPTLFWVRVALCLICLLLVLLTFSTAIVAYVRFDGADMLRWRRQDGGWDLHVVSTASEWIMSAAFCGYIATFAADLRRVSMDPPAVSVRPP